MKANSHPPPIGIRRASRVEELSHKTGGNSFTNASLRSVLIGLKTHVAAFSFMMFKGCLEMK